MYQTILIGYDDSPRARDALALGLALAAADTQLVVCCVYPDEAWAAPLYEVPPEVRLRGEAERRLEGARERIGERAGVSYVVRPAGSAADGLHAEAEDRQTDVLVVGSSHRGALGRVYPGSVTEQALHDAPCAVAVAPAGLRSAAPLAFARIGVAFDGGEESRRALVVGAEIARTEHGRLQLVTVAQIASATWGWGGVWAYAEIREDLRRLAQERAEQALAGLGAGVVTDIRVLDGIPAQELVASSTDLDLLVMGSRGYGPLHRVITGTVSGAVARSAACPILVLPRGAVMPRHAAREHSAAATA